MKILARRPRPAQRQSARATNAVCWGHAGLRERGGTAHEWPWCRRDVDQVRFRSLRRQEVHLIGSGVPARCGSGAVPVAATTELAPDRRGAARDHPAGM